MNQREKILQLLEDRQEAGVTNIELNEIAFRYGARLAELRKEGYRIRSQHIKGAIWRFTLLDLGLPLFETLLAPLSACCGAPISEWDFCGDCHEHA